MFLGCISYFITQRINLRENKTEFKGRFDELQAHISIITDVLQEEQVLLQETCT